MHDEELRQWLEEYIKKHPHHPTAVLARYQFIGYAKRALDAYLEGKYFLPQEKGGEGADPNKSGLRKRFEDSGNGSKALSGMAI